MGRPKKIPRSTMGSTSQQTRHPRRQQQPPPPPPPPLEQQQPVQQREDRQLHGLMHEVQQQLERQRKEKEVIVIDDDEDQEMPQQKSSAEEEENKNDEYIIVDLAPLQKYLTCPICLGILRQTRAVTECIHRFCKECIDKAMRLGNHECPACRTHVVSKRSLREDLRFDILIAALYPDINNIDYDEDLDLNEEERATNEKIQASIAQTWKRQAEANPKRMTMPMTTNSGSRRKSQGVGRRGRKRKIQNNHIQVSDDDEDVNVIDHDEDKHDELVVNTGKAGSSTEFAEVSEMPSWGKGGKRTQNRQEKHYQGHRVRNLVNHLDQLQVGGDNSEELDLFGENITEVEIFVALITLDGQTLPSLEHPYISCPASHSVRQLHQLVANRTGVKYKEVKLLLVTEPRFPNEGLPRYDPSQGDLLVLKSRETVGEVRSKCPTEAVLVLGYMRQFGK